MSINKTSINKSVINGAASASGIIDTGVGLILSFEQSIVIQGSGLIISIEQTVQLLTKGDGLILTFEQSVITAGSTLILSFEQTVLSTVQAGFYQRNQWYATITIGGVIVPDNQLRGVWKYTHSESNSALFDFGLLPPLGVQDLFSYQGKVVTCDIQTPRGIRRIFTGKVDIPEVDVMNEYIMLRCTDNRELRMASGAVDPATIGAYSTTVFGDVVDTKQQLADRLTVVPYSLDWDGYGQSYFTPWQPKSTPDYTITDGFIYRREPMIRIESAAQVTNQVVINFKYAYQRWHQGTINYNWAIPYNGGTFLTKGPTLLRREMVETAIDGAGWPVYGNIGYTPILAAGFYQVNGVYTAWSTRQSTGVSSQKTDSSGNVILDNAGKPIVEFTETSSIDLSRIMCFGASWVASNRWSQNMQESYTLTVNAPQSQARYGVVTNTENITLTDPDSSVEWEGSDPSSLRPVGMTVPGFSDQTNSLSEYNNATIVLINRARTRILAAHRDSRVSFERSIWPEIDLRHTVEISGTRIDAKGKVVGITHTLDTGTGEAYTGIDLAIYRTTGSQTESSFGPPTRPTDSTATPYQGFVGLGSHYGEDPDQPGAELWTGHIGNIWKDVRTSDGNGVNHIRTTYPESFIVDTPDIPSNYRDQRNLSASQNYNVSIPSNTLVWTTVGK